MSTVVLRMKGCLKLSLFLVGLICATEVRAQILTSGFAHSCLWSGGETDNVKCWGDNTYGQIDVPNDLGKIIDLQAGGYHTCALVLRSDAKSREISCWGDKTGGKTKVRADIVNPIMMSVGEWHACAIYVKSDGETTIGCWGHEDSGRVNPPLFEIRHPTSIFAGPNYSCAVHSVDKLQCWGVVDYEASIKNDTNIWPGSGLNCAHGANDDITCWTNSNSVLSPSIKISRRYQVCELNLDGLSCRDKQGRILPIPERAKHPWQFSVGNFHVCTLGQYGVDCFWTMGEESADDLVVKVDPIDFILGPTLRSMDQAAQFLSSLSDCVYEYDARFLRRVVSLLEKNKENHKIFIMWLIIPYLEDLDYSFVKNHFIKPSLANLDQILIKNKIGDSHRWNHIVTREDKENAESVLLASLETASAVVSQDDRLQISALLKRRLKGEDLSEDKESWKIIRNLSEGYNADAYLFSRTVLLKRIETILGPSTGDVK